MEDFHTSVLNIHLNADIHIVCVSTHTVYIFMNEKERSLHILIWQCFCGIPIWIIAWIMEWVTSQIKKWKIFRSSHPKVLCNKMFLKIPQNSQESIFDRVAFLIKLQAKACNFIKKRLWHSFFPVNFEKFLRTLFLIEHFRWLLLKICYCKAL